MFWIMLLSRRLAERGRAGKLAPDDVQNGTFTLTNHGTAGSLFATPVINQPQSGILGTGLIQKRPVVVNDAIAIKPMVYLSYSFDDHRILDGASADTFLATVVQALENWQCRFTTGPNTANKQPIFGIMEWLIA